MTTHEQLWKDLFYRHIETEDIPPRRVLGNRGSKASKITKISKGMNGILGGVQIASSYSHPHNSSSLKDTHGFLLFFLMIDESVPYYNTIPVFLQDTLLGLVCKNLLAFSSSNRLCCLFTSRQRALSLVVVRCQVVPVRQAERNWSCL